MQTSESVLESVLCLTKSALIFLSIVEKPTRSFSHSALKTSSYFEFTTVISYMTTWELETEPLHSTKFSMTSKQMLRFSETQFNHF